LSYYEFIINIAIVYILLLITKYKSRKMGYKVKIQRVERGATKSFYVNFPASIAEAGRIEKGEEMEWFIEDRDTYVLKRIIKSKSLIINKKR
jgi:hypothetical protein